MYGADVAQLHALATQFERAADQLDQGRREVGEGIRISAWAGPVAVKFRLVWDSDHSRRIHDAATRLRDAARRARANADDQDRVSAATAGGLPFGDYGSAPNSTADHLSALHGMDFGEDGVRVQRVVCEDGQVRFIIYINGTNTASDGVLGADDNAALMLGAPNDTLERIREKIGEAMADDPGAELMLVGYSQGGIVAQRLADEGGFNISMIVTAGSPTYYSPGGYGGAEILRLEHNGDIVPASDLRGPEVVAGGAAVIGAAAILRASEAARAAAYSGQLPAAGADTTFTGGSTFQWAAGGYPHTDHGDYTWLADRFDESDDPQHVAMREQMARFHGRVTGDEK